MRKLCLLFIFFLAGCAGTQPQQHMLTQERGSSGVVNILDANRLQQGGKLVIIPFNPGAGVPASAQLDRLALLIIKSATETFEDSPSPFEIVFGEQASRADLAIIGHISHFADQVKGMKSWLPGEKNIGLGIKGKLIERKAGKTVVQFTLQKEGSPGYTTHEQLAEVLGREMAQFLMKKK